jgi:excisionase family DNA binding protein
MPANEDHQIMLTLWEVARLLGIGLRTLRRHIAAGNFPKPIRIGGTLRYSRKAVLKWIDARSEEGNT